MDIDKLEAGREIDSLVAEKVMGWHLAHGDTEWLDSEGWHGAMAWGFREYHQEWAPSRNMSDAWQAFMQMKHPPKDDITVPPETEFYRTVIEKDGEFSAGWLWQSLGRVAWFGKYLGNGKTAEVAICRAVLKSHGR